MLNRKVLKQKIKRLSHFKTWQLIVLFLISSMICATFLRLNNIGMIERRSAVINADIEGDESKIQDRLYELQRYVSAHMNSDMGKGIYLEKMYQNAVKEAYDTASSSITKDVYKLARDTCDPKFTMWSPAYVACVSQELQNYPEGENLASEVIKPSPENYLHVFATPLWSPDFAGWSFLISLFILLAISSRILTGILLHLIIKYKFYDN